MPKENKKPSPAKPKATPAPSPLSRNKQELIIGIALVVLSFVGVVGVFYFMIGAQRTKIHEVESLREQVNFLNAEKSTFQQKVTDLQDEVGSSLKVDKIVSEAGRIYGAAEKNRKEGYLWIDRKRDIGMVTLGILNGVTPGTRLTVYDGTQQTGYVRVESALDVIAYAQPVNKRWKDFDKDYYRVLYEQ